MSDAERRTEELSAFLDGELESGPAAELRERLERDPELRAELELLRRTVDAVRTLPAERAPAELRERLAAALSSEAAPGVKRGRLVGVGGWVAGISAVAASLLIAAFLFQGSQDDAPVGDGWESAKKRRNALEGKPARQVFKNADEFAQDEARSLADREAVERDVAGGTIRTETAAAKDAGAFRGPNSGVQPGLRSPSDEPPPPKPPGAPGAPATAPGASTPDAATAAGEVAGRGEPADVAKLTEQTRKGVRARAVERAAESRAQPEQEKEQLADKTTALHSLLKEKEEKLNARKTSLAASARTDDEAQSAALGQLTAGYLSFLATADRPQIVNSLKLTAGGDQTVATYALLSVPGELRFEVGSAQEARDLEQVLLRLSLVAADDTGALLDGVLDKRQAGKEAAPDEGKARASESKKLDYEDKLTTSNEILVTSMGRRSIATFEVRLAADDASLVSRWGGRLFPYKPPPVTVMGKKSAGVRFGDDADGDGDVDFEEDEGEEGAAARAKRRKPAPAPDPGVGGGGGGAGAAGPARSADGKAAKRPSGGNKNERDARRERMIRIVIFYPKSPEPDPSPAAESKGK